MSIRGLKGGFLKFLSDSDLDAIHFATLEILNETGIEMEYKPALEIFKDHGAKVDFKNNRVKINEDLLKKGLSSAPSSFTLYGKNEDFDIKLDTERVYTMGGCAAVNTLDLNGNYRLSLFDDLIKLTILQDKMSNQHIVHGLVIPSDYEEYGIDRLLFAGVFPYTNKNYCSQSQTGADGVREHIKMAAVVQGSEEAVRQRPMFTEGACLVSPLKHGYITSEVIIECAKNNIPVYVEVDALPGATTPAPIAGTLVEQNANILAGIVLAQLVNPGAPCIYCIASGFMDMTTGGYSAAAPENNLLHCATAQVAHYYNLPFQGGAGVDAKINDAQVGYEVALQVLSNALAGTNIISLIFGQMEMMLTASYEKVIIDNDIVGAVFRMLKGFEVNDNTLSTDLLKRISLQPGGHFLSLKETSQYVRQNNWLPGITNRDVWSTWKSNGAKSMSESANYVARKILKENIEPVISREQSEEILKMAISFQNKVLEKMKSEL
jgi:trimethylamine--corrinoid protein Co-methyltransferase